MLRLSRFVSVLLALLLGLSACNLPGNRPTASNAEAVLTAAAQTVEANLTQSAIFNPPGASVIATNTQPFPTTGALPTNTPAPASATQNCDDADFVADITVPDGTTLSKDESFTKTWRLKNTGTCSWTPSYSVVFSSGDSMGGPANQALAGNVNPGQEVDISVNLKAPSSNGSYKGWWGLRNASGVMFAQFYVDIKVGGGGGIFAVTSVTYNVTTFDENTFVDCPKVTANITANGAGTVTYTWTRSDGSSSPTETLDFASAGTKSVVKKWYLGSGASGSTFWLGIYIDDPNHQDFGHANVSKCTAP